MHFVLWILHLHFLKRISALVRHQKRRGEFKVRFQALVQHQWNAASEKLYMCQELERRWFLWTLAESKYVNTWIYLDFWTNWSSNLICSLDKSQQPNVFMYCLSTPWETECESWGEWLQNSPIKEMLFTNVNVNHASNKRHLHLHLDVSNMLSLKELAVHILILFFPPSIPRSLKLNVDLHKDGKCYRSTSTILDIHI